MRAWQIVGGFGLDHLELVELPDPTPGPGEVVIRIDAVTLNARDLMMVKGEYNPRQRLPLVPCSDACGEVVAIGSGVSRVGLGDRVIPSFAPGWIGGKPDREQARRTLGGPLPGTASELFVAAAEGVVRAPSHLTDAEAAALPCAGLTAWTALIEDGPLAPGETVLVIGSGGVSLFGLQIARSTGVRVVAITRSRSKMELFQTHGADLVIDSTVTPAWGAAVREATGGRGVDHVLEVGGAGTLEQSLAATRFGGHVALIGVLAGAAAPLRLTDIFMRRIRAQGVLVGHRQGLEALVDAADSVLPRPIIDRTFDFDRLPEAFEYLASGDHFGKVSVRVG